MKMTNRWFVGVGIFAMLVGVMPVCKAIADPPLYVLNINQTDLDWNGQNCVDPNCAQFTLPAMGYDQEVLPVPSSGTVTLSAYFTDTSGTYDTSCDKDFDVATSSVARVTVSFSSPTYTCDISVP